jgi:hypothetical protein
MATSLVPDHDDGFLGRQRSVVVDDTLHRSQTSLVPDHDDGFLFRQRSVVVDDKLHRSQTSLVPDHDDGFLFRQRSVVLDDTLHRSSIGGPQFQHDQAATTAQQHSRSFDAPSAYLSQVHPAFSSGGQWHHASKRGLSAASGSDVPFMLLMALHAVNAQVAAGLAGARQAEAEADANAAEHATAKLPRQRVLEQQAEEMALRRQRGGGGRVSSPAAASGFGQFASFSGSGAARPQSAGGAGGGVRFKPPPARQSAGHSAGDGHEQIFTPELTHGRNSVWFKRLRDHLVHHDQRLLDEGVPGAVHTAFVLVGKAHVYCADMGLLTLFGQYGMEVTTRTLEDRRQAPSDTLWISDAATKLADALQVLACGTASAIVIPESIRNPVTGPTQFVPADAAADASPEGPPRVPQRSQHLLKAIADVARAGMKAHDLMKAANPGGAAAQ